MSAIPKYTTPQAPCWLPQRQVLLVCIWRVESGWVTGDGTRTISTCTALQYDMVRYVLFAWFYWRRIPPPVD